MIKPTGKQRVAMRKISRRITRAAAKAQLAKTPAENDRLFEKGMKATRAFTNLSTAVKK